MAEIINNIEYDKTFELAKQIVQHIIDYHNRHELVPEQISKIDFLKNVSDVRNFLKNPNTSKEVENKLYNEFKEEFEEDYNKYGKNGMDLKYFKSFYDIGKQLYDYNIDIFETIDIKTILYTNILNTDFNSNPYLYKDKFNNIFYSIDEDMTLVIGTKENILNNIKTSEILFKNLLDDTKDFKGNEILSISITPGYIAVQDMEQTLNNLNDIFSELNKDNEDEEELYY